jgi:FAD/FMN-containing dehydrogenase
MNTQDTHTQTQIDRRRFLTQASSLALLQLPWLSGCKTTLSSDGAQSIAPEAWRELEKNLSGSALRPGDSGFESLVRPWNLRYRREQPAGLARCRTVDDIRVCLQWAQQHRVPLVARSGGHSYAGYSTTDGLMIDISLINSLDYDQSTRKARVGAGARNATLYANLPQYQCAVTHGRCKQVGVGGLVLGGGIGFNMRKHGLLIDQLVETDLMTADGKIHRCSKEENPHYLWACQGGGGGNFGINTSFTFQTFEIGMVTAFNIAWQQNIDTLFPQALDLIPTLPDEFGCKLWLVQNKTGLTLSLLGQYAGPEADLRRLLSPLLSRGGAVMEKIEHIRYWDAQNNILTENGSPEYSHERSRYVFKPISASGARSILAHLRAWPGTEAQASWKAFLTGGAISRVANSATAYSHRDAIMLSSIELNWAEHDSAETVAKNEVWLKEFHEAMAEYTSRQCYQNFIDDSEPDFLHAYYGANLEKLIRVKRETDPRHIFRYPQGIPCT